MKKEESTSFQEPRVKQEDINLNIKTEPNDIPLSQNSVLKKDEIIHFDQENHILNYKLNETQKKILDYIDQGKNVFFTGSAGTGKSVLIHHIVDRLKKKFQDPSFIAVTSTTGLSALQIQGVTIHRWSGIGHESDFDQMRDLCWGCEKSTKFKFNDSHGGNWRRTKVLIIDEISMLGPNIFDYLNFIGQEIRGNKEPFGGIQIVASGDFFQLSPIKKLSQNKVSYSLSQNQDKEDEYNDQEYCFEGKTWDECFDYHIELKEVYRQLDRNFSSILNSIRVGELTWNVKNTLQEVKNKNLENPTRLFATNSEVNEINQNKLSELKGSSYYFKSHDYTYEYIPNLETKETEDILMCNFDYYKLFEDTNIPSSIELKVGSKVMLTSNLDPQLVNGLQGVILEFREIKNAYQDYHYEFKNSKKNEILRYWLSQHEYLPYVEFENGQKLAIPPHLSKMKDQNIEARRVFLPLRLSWAMRLTLTNVEINCEKLFTHGQLYVALSRVKTLEGLSLINLKFPKKLSHIKVNNFYRTLPMKKKKVKVVIDEEDQDVDDSQLKEFFNLDNSSENIQPLPLDISVISEQDLDQEQLNDFFSE